MLPWGWLARLSFVMASGVTLEDGIYVVGFLAIDETFHQVGCVKQKVLLNCTNWDDNG